MRWACGDVSMRASSFLKGLYNFYNYKYFDSKLPQNTKLFFVTKIGKSKSVAKSTCALTYFSDPPVIVIQRTKKAKSMRYVVADLLHEMSHLSKPRAEHGEVFQEEMKRLANAGAFQDVW
jgi:hypothetical protein